MKSLLTPYPSWKFSHFSIKGIKIWPRVDASYSLSF